MRVSNLTAGAATSLFVMSALAGCSHTEAARVHAHPSPQATACEPANGREGQPGCWELATAPVNPSAVPLYWHVYEIESATHRGEANPPSKVFRAHGRTWLVAVAGQHWTAKTGRHVASVGPLQLLSTRPHTASFLEATFTPGMSSRIHTHPGPEAWVVLEGEQCLETPEGVIRGKAGDAMMVRGGIPMQLFGTGTAMRKALVLIIHPTSEGLGTTYREWRPTGACVTS
jgi:quercetin dioxygenase-like cupin family protein